MLHLRQFWFSKLLIELYWVKITQKYFAQFWLFSITLERERLESQKLKRLGF